jgi:hypothetical protein
LFYLFHVDQLVVHGPESCACCVYGHFKGLFFKPVLDVEENRFL